MAAESSFADWAWLALVPGLITLWFMHDGGLGNGLNRLSQACSLRATRP